MIRKVLLPLIFAAFAASAFLITKNRSENVSPLFHERAGVPGVHLPEGFNTDSLLSVATNPELDEVLIDYEGFTVSFNPTMHLPNWVAWKITRDRLETGTVARKDRFRPDENVPGCATLSDYRNSGFDRGHMAPAGDMKWSEKAMANASFLTNICPQSYDLNNGAWRSLEEKCRANALRDSLLIVVCGPVLSKGFIKSIGETPVPVPNSFFKVILSPSTHHGAQGIGFIMPNSTVEGGMQAASMSIDEVEELTGHDFFYHLPDSLEHLLESGPPDFNRFSTGK